MRMAASSLDSSSLVLPSPPATATFDDLLAADDVPLDSPVSDINVDEEDNDEEEDDDDDEEDDLAPVNDDLDLDSDSQPLESRFCLITISTKGSSEFLTLETDFSDLKRIYFHICCRLLSESIFLLNKILHCHKASDSDIQEDTFSFVIVSLPSLLGFPQQQ